MPSGLSVHVSCRPWEPLDHFLPLIYILYHPCQSFLMSYLHSLAVAQGSFQQRRGLVITKLCNDEFSIILFNFSYERTWNFRAVLLENAIAGDEIPGLIVSLGERG